jgi:hypothetical protein
MKSKLKFWTGWDSVRRLVRVYFDAPTAYREAVNLAESMARRHYPDGHPEWRVADDTTGVIFQISNMASGLVREDSVFDANAASEGRRSRFLDWPVRHLFYDKRRDRQSNA